MSEFKGTKGEWEYYPISEESNGYVSIEIPRGSIVVYNGIYPYSFSEDKEKCIEILEANAKLIACAPEMLNLLSSIVNDENLVPKFLWDKIQLLIKKATE
jgi:hypothetical protein